MNYRKQRADEAHAIEYVDGKPERRCATCKHMGVYRHKSLSSPRYCTLRPVSNNKSGYKGVVEDKNVCDLWEPK